MELKSWAKINLVLKILGKRPDGFHEIYSVMQMISLHDTVRLTLGGRGIRVHSDHEDCPDGPGNIAFQAATRFGERTGIPIHCDIHITKRIPIAAGMGGGSSNAATVLQGLNMLHDEPLAGNELQTLAGSLGSDVPFFLIGGTARAVGRGEIVTILPFPGSLHVLLINPGYLVSTANVYRNFQLTSPPPVHNIHTAFELEGGWRQDLYDSMHNDLERSVFQLHPDLSQIKDWIGNVGATAALVSGSGATVFGLFEDSHTAHQVYKAARETFPWTALEVTMGCSGV